jgi:hypothetical protein
VETVTFAFLRHEPGLDHSLPRAVEGSWTGTPLAETKRRDAVTSPPRCGRSETSQRRGVEMNVVEKAKQEMKELAGEVRGEAVRLVEEARDQASDQAERRKDETAQKLGNLAAALRDAARRLEQRNRGGLVTYADRWADQVDRASSYLRDHELPNLVEDLEGFARRRPDVFLGGAFVAGVLAARFLKSSSDRLPRLLATEPGMAGRSSESTGPAGVRPPGGL